jgi:hypothetical protein
MKLAPTAKSGLVVVAVGVLIMAGVAVWMKSIQTTITEFPVSAGVGTVKKEFTVNYDAIHFVSVGFDPSISLATASCLLGGQESDPSLECAGIPPSFRFSWQLFCDGQPSGTGTSARMGSRSRNGDVIIFGFPARKKHQYMLTLTFEHDSRALQPPPIVRVELGGFKKEEFLIAGAVLDYFALVLFLIGGVMFLASTLTAKFQSWKNSQPNRVGPD